MSASLRPSYGWLLAGVLAAAVAATFLVRDRLDLVALENAVRGLGAWGAVAFALIFAAATVLFLPGSAFGLAGGALFGPVLGTVMNLAGGTLGATLAFLVARHLAGDWVARRAGGRLKQVVDGVEAEGWRFVALVRLAPAVPFNLANYALGLTRIPLGEYVLATAISMIPGTAAYAWLGHAGRGALSGDDAAALRYGLLGLAVLAAIAFLPRLLRRVRRSVSDRERVAWTDAAALSQALAAPVAPKVIDVRGADEFAGPLGHIPRAANIPVDALVANPTLACAGSVVLVCLTDRRSARAAEALAAAGHHDVSVLRGGMKAWTDALLPVTHGTLDMGTTPKDAPT
jgi:uncharacterized membrane protein YdjX (TVP38/TMEM64 family)/rhodanese-related sulfurtransferase